MTAEEYIRQATAIRQRVLDTARKCLGDMDEAEDIAQDVMLKLWLMRDELWQPVDGIAAVITRNLCIDRLRKQQPTTDITQLAEAEAPGDDGEQIERMMQVIDTLPSTQRTILRMRHLEGMEMREIALVLGSTEVAVRKTLSRARMAVRRKLLALLAAACVVGAVIMVGMRWAVRSDTEDECVAYVYGRKCTDEAIVMQEMRRTMGEVVEDSPEATVESQLNELFGD